MRIVYVAQRLVYPPDAGTPIRNYNLVLRACARNDVYAFGFSDPKKAPAPLAAAGIHLDLLPPPAPRSSRRRALGLLSSVLPDMGVRSHSPALLSLLQEKLPAIAPHVVQLQALDMTYAIPVIRRAAPDAILVLDQHNAEYILQKRAFLVDARRPRRWPAAAYSFAQWLRLRRYERWACDACDLVLAMSEADRTALLALGISTPVEVIPNGVDLGEHRNVLPEPTLSADPGPHFVFPGKMDFRPNVDAAVWFAGSIWPTVQARLPGAHFWIVGRDPHPSVTALDRLPNVHVTGEVPDMRPYVTAATAVVVPLRVGSGTKLKILEAAALRRPIITTDIGIEGYPAVPGRDFLLANSPQELAAACQTVAGNPGLAEDLGQNAYRHLAAPLDWDNVYPRLEEVYARSVSG